LKWLARLVLTAMTLPETLWHCWVTCARLSVLSMSLRMRQQIVCVAA
jgi:hypothetical protein